PNLTYQVAKAEQASFPDQTFDLITVAQAIHWFDFEAFYAEVKRTLKPDGVIAIVGYSLFSIRPPVDRIIQRLYADTLSGYWDPERKYVDEHYQTIPFPFREIEPPALAMTGEWTLDECVGYLNTWSAVQHYLRKNHENPVGRTREELQEHWEENTRETVTFPLLLRVGKQA
ncbi:MAG: class I SAM-dependent methyltransferase, partial [Ferruginibacter sp.]|nr:class I SAM-dependent methyltransferase [Cytophagales bacterium]